MGYFMWLRGANFHMNAEDIPKAKQAVVHFFQTQEQRPNMREPLQLTPINSLEDIMSALGWPLRKNSSGDVYDIEFTGEKYYGIEEGLWECLAPFVRDNSYIEMGGSDGSYWRWVFSEEQLLEVAGEITFDYEKKASA